VEQWLERHEVFRGRFFTVITGTAMIANGQTARRDVVEHIGGVAVVPIHAGRVLLVRQYRIAAGRETLELPAGLLHPGEAPEEAAARELAEELGYRAGRLIPLASYYTSPGYTDERTHIFLGLDLTPTDGTTDWDEHLHPEERPLEGLQQALLEGAFSDGKTVIGLSMALAWLARHGDTAG
jgi:ADP-ribose pyrophosphatase